MIEDVKTQPDKPIAICNRCGGAMKPSKAIVQTWSGAPEWPGDTQIALSPGGPGVLVDCLEC